MLRELLSTVGFDAAETDSPEQALSLIKDGFDAVISDIRMPGYDGHTFCRTLRSSAETKDLIIIASSGSVFADDQRLAVASGFNDFLPKPVLPIYTGQHAGSSAHASFSARVAAGISPPKHVGATRTAGQVAAVCPSPIDVACRHFATLNEAIRRRGARSAQREPGFARAVATKRQPARRHLGCWPRSWVWITLPGWSQPMWVDP
jgi:CheY-like chemotaxis protein